MRKKCLTFCTAAFALSWSLLTPQHAPAQVQPVPAPTLAAPPVIVVQPNDQMAGYGDDVAFTVVASEAAVGYEWRKDGRALTDYANVAGANSATLALVGVAQSDAGAYSVIVTNSGGAVTSLVATLTVGSMAVFSDDFESGTLEKWTPFSRRGRLSISTDQNHTPGGSSSAMLTNSLARMYHNFGTKLAWHTKATFWIYDDGGSQTRCYGDLRGYRGRGYALDGPPGGRAQLFAIGRYGVGFGTNHTGNLKGERVDPKKYQGRVERGRNTGWFNLNAPGAPGRSVGWHKFEIERADDGATVQFRVDGVLGRTITGAKHVLLDCVTIGSAAAGNRVGKAWIDDVKVEGFPWRFDWASKTSDSNGLFDWMKLRESGTNSLATQITQIATVSQADGSTATAKLGPWATDGSAIYGAGMRGSVDYVLAAPVDDAYRIEIEGRERSSRRPSVALPLIVSIDGEYLGRFILPYQGATNGFVHCFTPFIKTGSHTLRVYWDNTDDQYSLYLQAVRLQSLQGPAVDSSGLKTWVLNRLRAQCGVEVAPASSLVSPVCVEGRGQYLSMMSLSAGPPGQLRPVPVQPGAGHRWYANVPLLPDGATHLEVSHQNGGLRGTGDIQWQVMNLLEADDITIRKGDSLLLTALPAGASSGAVSITVQGVTNYISDTTTPVAHGFDQPGTFSVLGTFNATGASRGITVRVVDASFDGPVAGWVAKRRYWNCTNVPPEAVLDADPRLNITQVSIPPSLGANGRRYSLTTDAAEPRCVVARLGANGPVLANTTVQGFRLFNAQDTYLRIMRRYEDGSQLIQAAMVLSPPVPEVTMGLRLIVSGSVFEDGTLLRTLRASDFDSLGICPVRFIRAPGVKTSVCHTTKAYQRDELIGWPTYEP